MSQTYTQSKQLHLFNIITLAQDKLQSNFNRILIRLNSHQKSIENNEKNMHQLNNLIKTISNQLLVKFQQQQQQNQLYIGQVKDECCKMVDCFKELNNRTDFLQGEVEKMGKAQAYFTEFLDSDCKSRISESQKLKEKIRNMEYQLTNVGSNLTKKENVAQVLKLKQSITQFNQQMSKLESQQKFVQFKLDKFQINNQKLQKNQLNKQMMLIKDLEQKIRKQLKNNIQTMTSSQTNHQNTGKTSTTVINILPSQPATITSSAQSPKMVVTQAQSLKENCLFNRCNSSSEIAATVSEKPLSENIERFSSFENQAVSYPQSQESQLTQKLVNQLNDTINFHQRRFDVIQREIKEMAQWWESSHKVKKNSPTQFEQKLNSIKPEFLRIWAKCDALEQKTAVFDRKMEEKNIQVSTIMDTIKQTQAGKFDQKLKLIQAETIVILKDIRTKLEGKVNCVDFQKFSKNTSDKIQGLFDQIILKCDKAEVKKALLFLQSKIKEIILVISEEEQNQKDALLTKKQLKCISCDKEVEKFLGTASSMKGNWDAFPLKEHSNDNLGRFGMTSYGTLARKLKRIDKEMPNLSQKRNKESTHSQSRADLH